MEFPEWEREKFYRTAVAFVCGMIASALLRIAGDVGRATTWRW